MAISRSGSKSLSRRMEAFSAAVTEWTGTTGPRARPSILREVELALREGCGRVVAVGGDGTISMAGEALARFDGPRGGASLGIIPAGTANVLAGELGIPGSLEAAVATVAEDAPSITLDAIQVEDRFCFTQVGIGPDALMIRDIISSTMRYGEGWAAVLFVMIAIDFRTGLRTAVEAVPVIALTMLAVNYPIKRFFRRRRPFIAFVKARVVGTRPRDFSFPSGHAAAGFAGALVLGAHAPAFALVFYALAVIVSLSRVYLGVHYPSDVAFGAFLGALIAAIYRFILRALLPGLG